MSGISYFLKASVIFRSQKRQLKDNYILCIMRLNIVVEFQPDTTIVDLQGSNISSQTIDQSTETSMITDNTMTDKSQQIGSRISSRYYVPMS